ncbi:hypothetical protein ACJZ2D_013333 [Fusarium nematophilum]
MLDIDMGSFPFVTPSSATIAGIIGGLSLNPRNISETVGVVKAYTQESAQAHQQGESDGVDGLLSSPPPLLLYSPPPLDDKVNSLRQLDVLDTFDTTKVAVAYQVDGAELESYPANLDILDRAEVVYKDFPGWQKSASNCRTYYDLPQKARGYVEVRCFTWLGGGLANIESP